MLAECIGALAAAFGESRLLRDVPMSGYTSFKAGGKAAALFTPQNPEEIVRATAICRGYGYPWYITGNGTNLLVRDEGFDGLIIRIADQMSGIELTDEVCIEACAGVKLSKLAVFARDNGLSGLEFASGIPGTVGGGVFMNAGAYDGEIKDVLSFAVVMDEYGKHKTLVNEEMEFSYRTSRAQRERMIILSAGFRLSKADSRAITEKMNEQNRQRREKQPLDIPSAGSAFKRPPGHYAAKLISDAGLKGFSIGGAQVSVKHSGFIVNTGDATANDILNLIKHIQTVIKKEYGVDLEPEIRVI